MNFHIPWFACSNKGWNPNVFTFGNYVRTYFAYGTYFQNNVQR